MASKTGICPFLCTLKMDLRLQNCHWEIGKIVFNEWDFEKQYLGWKITFVPLHPRPPTTTTPAPANFQDPRKFLTSEVAVYFSPRQCPLHFRARKKMYKSSKWFFRPEISFEKIEKRTPGTWRAGNGKRGKNTKSKLTIEICE